MNNQPKICNPKSKIVIVGAGPAGSSLAIRLVAENFDVTLIEREKFPRQKLCGEFISPECLRHFRELGVLDEMLAVGGDRIAETVFYEPGGHKVSIPSKWFRGGVGGALSISRAEMDLRLLDKARKLGIEVLEQTSAVDLLIESGCVSGIKARHKNGEITKVRAALTIDATGRARVLGKLAERRKTLITNFDLGITNYESEITHFEKSQIRNPKSEIGPIRNPRSGIPNRVNRLVGFKTHLENVHLEKGVCEIYFFPGGYGGLSFVENGLANHCFLIDSVTVRQFGGDAGRIVEKVVMRNKRAAQTLKDSRPVNDWLAVAVDGFGRKDAAPAPGLFAVGDASAFIDPFTGSGMLMALEGAEILAEIIAEYAFDTEKMASVYESRQRLKFRRRLRICSVLRRLSSAPRLTTLAVRGLGLSGKARELLARSTRRTLLPNEIEP